jgi:hypothetical protein
MQYVVTSELLFQLHDLLTNAFDDLMDDDDDDLSTLNSTCRSPAVSEG